MNRRRMMLEKRILQIYQPGWKAFENATIAKGEEWAQFENDYLKVGPKYSSSSGKAVVLKADFTPYKKLVISARRGAGAIVESGYICVGWSKDVGFYYDNVNYVDVTKASLETFEFDISGAEGEKYIHLRWWVEGSGGLFVYDIHLE